MKQQFLESQANTYIDPSERHKLLTDLANRKKPSLIQSSVPFLGEGEEVDDDSESESDNVEEIDTIQR